MAVYQETCQWNTKTSANENQNNDLRRSSVKMTLNTN